MKTSPVLHVLCAISVTFLLLSAVQPVASSQAPEPPRPGRLSMRADLRASLYPGLVPQAQSPISPQAPEALGDWSKITYETYADGDGEIFRMNGDLTNLVQLTNNTEGEWYPELDRGCTRVVYSRLVSNPEIYRMSADGSSQTRLTDNGTDEFAPAWSPDGTRIAYMSNAGGGDDEIYIMTDAGGSQTNLTNNSVDDWAPTWSPDGTRIAFSSYRNSQNRIWVMNQDGSGQTQLNSTPNSIEAAWSPDGTQIAYDADSNGDGWTELWLMNSNGSNQHMIYDPPESQTDAYVRAWSPDGRYITFSRVSWTYINPNWRWTAAYMDAYDTVTSGIVRLSYDSMAWNAAWQSCDNNAPATSVAALPVTSPATFTINWSGMDAGGSEFKNFDVQLKIGAGAWTDWQLATTTTSAPFTGIAGHTYYFRSRGRDNAGNLEAYPGNPDAFTTVEALAPETGMTPLPTVVPYQFNVSWGGTDPGGSGIASYDVQVRDGPGGVWTDWQMGTTGTSAPYTGLGGHTYYFRSRARDYATNLEAWPVDYDAYTLVEGYAPNSEIVHLSAYTRGEALVRWDGLDPGGSGILNYDVQVRDGGGGTWTDWQTGVTSTSAGYTGTPGHTVYFRVRARDQAQNLEGWPEGDGDASTTFYAWSASGQAADNTGVPVVGASVASTPPSFAVYPSGPDGKFRLFSSDTTPGSHTLQINKAGYGTLPSASLPGDPGTWYDAFLPPSDNQVQNWGFEQGTFSPADWEAGGLVVPTISITPTHSGGYSARLGRQVSLFTPYLNISQDESYSFSPLMAMDNQGALHVVWSDYTDYSLHYARRSAAGVWSTSVQIPDSGIDPYPQLAVDPSGIVYVGWVSEGIEWNVDAFIARRELNGNWSAPVNISNSPTGTSLLAMVIGADGIVHVAMSDDGEIFYTRRALDGNWSNPENLSNDAVSSEWPKLAVEPGGVVHLVWNDSEIWYRRRMLDETWTTRLNISNSPGYSFESRVALGQSGTLHVVWSDDSTGNTDIYHTSRLSNGTWTSLRNLSQDPEYSFVEAIQSKSDGSVNVAWISGYQTLYHVRRDSTGTWGEKEIIYQGNVGMLSMQLAVNGLAHAVWIDVDDVFYTRENSGGGWLAPLNLSNDAFYSQTPQLLVDPQGAPHITWGGGTANNVEIYYTTRNVASSSGESRIRQEVDIPAGMTTPVLSFLYRAEDFTGNPENDFHALVRQGPITTPLFSTITDTLGWEHQWFDLTPWAGETVELEFGVNMPAGSPSGVVYLDEVSLGSAKPDLWVNVQSDTLYAIPGETVVTQIVYGNQGGAPTSSTLITYTLPTELEFVSASVTPTVTPGGLVWDLPGLTAGSQPYVIEVTTVVADSAVLFNEYESQAQIGGAAHELEVLNNQANIKLRVGKYIFLPLTIKRP